MEIPIYSPLKSRAGLLTRDGFMKNAFVEPVGENKFNCFRRPGLNPYSTNTGTPQSGRGIAALKDFNGVERLYVAQGGSVYAEGITRTVPGEWTASSGPSARISSAAGNELLFPVIIPYRGLLWAIGPGDATPTTGPNLTDRFMVAFSSDKGKNWNVVVDVADGTAGYPPGDHNFAGCVHLNRIYIATRNGGLANGKEIWYTEDGTNWTQASADHGGGAVFVDNLISHNDGFLYLFVDTATNPIRSSANGTTWAVGDASAAYNTGGGFRSQFGVVSFAGFLYVLGGKVSAGSQAQEVWQASTTAGAVGTWTEIGSDVLSTVLDSNADNACRTYMDGPICYLHYWETSLTTELNELWYSSDFLTWTLAKASSVINGGNQVTQYYQGSNIIDGTFVGCFTSTNNVQQADVYYYLETVTSGSVQISIGDVSGGFFDFAQNYARDQVVLKSEGAMYVLNTQYGVVTRVTDIDYPTITARGLVYLNGVFYVMDTDGNIFNSADEDATSWDPAEFVAAQFEPDGGVALIKHLNYIVAFGEYSTEMFYDAGNATGSPLLPVQNGVVQVGCADGDSVDIIDSQIFFVGQSKAAGQAVAKGKFIGKLNGTQVEKLSTPDIDRILDLDDFADTEATTFKVGGHSYYHLRLGTTGISIVYDASIQQWYVWTTRRSSFTNTVSSVFSTLGTATATATSSFSDGDQMVVSAFTGTHTNLNGTFNVQVDTNVLKWTVPAAYSGTSTGTGTMTGYAEDDFPVVCAASYQNKQLLQDKDNGSLYELNGTTYRDNSIYMDWRVRLPKLDGSTNENKFAAWADLISDRVSGNVLLRFSDDDCQSFTKFRARSMAGGRTRWHRHGQFRRRVYELRVTDNVAVKAEYLDAKFTPDKAERAK